MVLAAAAVVAAAIPFGFTLAHPSSNDRAYGAEIVRFAKRSLRLLLGADGWRVTRADEQDEQTGEMSFAARTQSFELYWVGGANSKDSDKADMTPLGNAQNETEPTPGSAPTAPMSSRHLVGRRPGT
ncbi:MAG: hypothetical protein QOJ37_2253 [Pseudonocardiales bacterium]|nr:hypothetical protein [Pseudonocardiales bacterium]